MNNLRMKPTKEVLIDLYYNKNMTLDEIGKFFNYADRQPISRAFKKYNIAVKSKSLIANEKFAAQHKIPTKEELQTALTTLSISKAATYFNINRRKLSILAKQYNIDLKYFKYTRLREKINSIEYTNYSNIELAKLLNISVSVIKYYKKTASCTLYTLQTSKKLLEEYDLNNQGLIKTIKANDRSLYDSILYHTKNHDLESKKYSERIFRIINDYTEERIDSCKYCSTRLKFYTVKVGYGSEHDFCRGCLAKHSGFGVSAISQKLFDKIYIQLSDIQKSLCFYANLNNEKIIKITNRDIINLSNIADNLNTNFYRIDFILDNKIIEFDGIYWHSKFPERDFAKLAFLKYKGYDVLIIKESEYRNNPDKVINECMNFLNQ